MTEKTDNPREALAYLRSCAEELDEMLAHFRWGIHHFPALDIRDVQIALTEAETALLWMTRQINKMYRQLEPPPVTAD